MLAGSRLLASVVCKEHRLTLALCRLECLIRASHSPVPAQRRTSIAPARCRRRPPTRHAGTITRARMRCNGLLIEEARTNYRSATVAMISTWTVSGRHPRQQSLAAPDGSISLTATDYWHQDALSRHVSAVLSISRYTAMSIYRRQSDALRCNCTTLRRPANDCVADAGDWCSRPTLLADRNRMDRLYRYSWQLRSDADHQHGSATHCSDSQATDSAWSSMSAPTCVMRHRPAYVCIHHLCVWGAQIELARLRPPATSRRHQHAVTRAADVCSIPTSAWFNAVSTIHLAGDLHGCQCVRHMPRPRAYRCDAWHQSTGIALSTSGEVPGSASRVNRCQLVSHDWPHRWAIRHSNPGVSRQLRHGMALNEPRLHSTVCLVVSYCCGYAARPDACCMRWQCLPASLANCINGWRSSCPLLAPCIVCCRVAIGDNVSRRYKIVEGGMHDRFHQSYSKVQFLGGGFGNGKTAAACVKALKLAKDYPGSNGLVARSTYPKLNDTIRREFLLWCPPHWIKRMPSRDENTMILKNGSTINFRYVAQRGKETEESKSNLLSATYDWIIVDQLEDPEF